MLYQVRTITVPYFNSFENTRSQKYSTEAATTNDTMYYNWTNLVTTTSMYWMAIERCPLRRRWNEMSRHRGYTLKGLWLRLMLHILTILCKYIYIFGNIYVLNRFESYKRIVVSVLHPVNYKMTKMRSRSDRFWFKSSYLSANTSVSTTEEPRSANELPTSGPTASQRSALRSLARRYRARRRRKLRADNADPAERRKRKRASKFLIKRKTN